MRPLAIITSLFIVALLLSSCDNSTENKGDNEPDSTTQNFTFEEYEFGDGGNSSYFNDVWIFDENNIWAVGEVYHDPVLSPTNEYNIVQWNGNKWIGRGRGFNSVGIYGLWPIDSSHIYFAVGIVLEYKNGEFNWMDFSQLNFSQGQSVQHLWGSSESNIWGVGPWGTIVHYDGSKWTKLDFDTQYYFYDITGIMETGEAYAIARNENYATMIVKLNNGSAETVYNNPNEWGFHSWVITYGENGKLYLGETSVWSYEVSSGKTEELYDLPVGQGINSICAYSYKDMYYFGSDAERTEKMIHYNGKRFANIELSSSETFIHGGSHSIGNLTAMTGFKGAKASIIIIKRQ